MLSSYGQRDELTVRQMNRLSQQTGDSETDTQTDRQTDGKKARRRLTDMQTDDQMIAEETQVTNRNHIQLKIYACILKMSQISRIMKQYSIYFKSHGLLKLATRGFANMIQKRRRLQFKRNPRV